MGFLKNVLGGKSNAFKAQEYQGMDKSQFGDAINQSMQNQNQLYGQQQGLYNQFGEMAAGRGPSLAQLQLQQGLQNAQAQQMAGAASMKGTNASLAQRQAGQNQAMMGANANMAAAQTRMQEQFGAMGAQAGLAGQMAQQQQGMLGTAGGLQQGQNALGLQNFQGAQGINAGVAAQNANINAGLAGGLIGGVAGAAGTMFGGPIGGALAQGATKAAGVGAAHGGEIPYAAAVHHYYEGGDVPDYSAGMYAHGADKMQQGITAGLTNMGKAFAPSQPQPAVPVSVNPGANESEGQDLSRTPDEVIAGFAPPKTPMFGGPVLAPVGPMVPPMAHGGPVDYTSGGQVPGKAPYAGDTEKNDVVPAMLTPEEVVLPKSISHDPEAAARFVEEINRKKHGHPYPHLQHFAQGGAPEVPTDQQLVLDQTNPALTEPPSDANRNSPPVDQTGAPEGYTSAVLPAGQTPADRARAARGEPPYYPDPGANDGGDKYYDAQGVIRPEFRDEKGNAPVGLGAAAERVKDIGALGNAAVSVGKALLDHEKEAPGTGDKPAEPGPARIPPSDATGGTQPGNNDFGYGKAFGQMEEGTQQAAEVKGNLGERQSQSWQKYNNDVAVQNAAFNQHLQEQQAENERLYKAVRDAKINPEHFWEDKTTGDRITAGIAIILGGIGSGLTGGPNAGLAAINRRIDQDIDSQKVNIQKGENLLAWNLSRTNNMIQAEMATRSMMLSAVQGDLARQAALAMGPEAQANAKVALGQIAMQRSGLERQLAAQRAMAGFLSGGGAGLQGVKVEDLPPEEQRKLYESQVRVDEVKPMVGKDGNPIIDQRTGKPATVITAVNRYARSPKDAEIARKELSMNREASLKLAKLEAFARKHPLGTPWPLIQAADRQEAESLLQDLSLYWNQSQEGLQRLNPGEREMVESMIRNPAHFWASATGEAKASLRVLRSAIEQKKQTVQDTYLLPIR